MYALVDCNNFYASCERVFNPKLRNRPVVILSNNDGCIIARSNEAKALGIGMGEPIFKMQHLVQLHNVAVLSSNYALYGDLSHRVMQTIKTLVDNMEVYSIDEVFLDLETYSMYDFQELGKKIRQRVFQWVGIPVSVGIAPTKTLAKVANHIAKKQMQYNGVFVMNTDELRISSLNVFPVQDVWGVGRKLSKHLQNAGINNAYDLSLANDAWVKGNFTIVGLKMVKELRGESCIPLEQMIQPKQNICTSRSFGKMAQDYSIVAEAVSNFAARCAEKLRRQNSVANYVLVFVTTNRFRQDLKQYSNHIQITLPVASASTPELIHYSLIGLKSIFKQGFDYKKAGVIVSGIVPENQVQTSLFDEVDREKYQKLLKSVDELNKKLGRDTVFFSAQRNKKQKWVNRQEQLSPCYTTRWSDLPMAIANETIIPYKK